MEDCDYTTSRNFPISEGGSRLLCKNTSLRKKGIFVEERGRVGDLTVYADSHKTTCEFSHTNAQQAQTLPYTLTQIKVRLQCSLLC